MCFIMKSICKTLGVVFLLFHLSCDTDPREGSKLLLDQIITEDSNLRFEYNPDYSIKQLSAINNGEFEYYTTYAYPDGLPVSRKFYRVDSPTIIDRDTLIYDSNNMVTKVIFRQWNIDSDLNYYCQYEGIKLSRLIAQ